MGNENLLIILKVFLGVMYLHNFSIHVLMFVFVVLCSCTCELVPDTVFLSENKVFPNMILL